MNTTTLTEEIVQRGPLPLRIIDRATLIAAIGGGIAMWFLLVNVAIDVLARTFTGRPLGLTLELTTYWWMPILVALSYALTEQRGDHITVTILLDRLSPRLHRTVNGIFSAVGAGLVSLLAWYAAIAAIDATEVRLIANSNPPLEYWQVKIVVFFGLVLLALQLLARAYRQFTSRMPADVLPPEGPDL